MGSGGCGSVAGAGAGPKAGPGAGTALGGLGFWSSCSAPSSQSITSGQADAAPGDSGWGVGMLRGGMLPPS
eukprot:5119761-Heterocapsa_arctica.AAC.1